MGAFAKVLLILLVFFVPPAEAKNCPNSQPCGNSCISWSKTCHIGRSSSSSSRRSTRSTRSSTPAPSVPASYVEEPKSKRAHQAPPIEASPAAVDDAPPPVVPAPVVAPTLASPSAEAQAHSRRVTFGALYAMLLVISFAGAFGAKREV